MRKCAGNCRNWAPAMYCVVRGSRIAGDRVRRAWTKSFFVIFMILRFMRRHVIALSWSAAHHPMSHHGTAILSHRVLTALHHLRAAVCNGFVRAQARRHLLVQACHLIAHLLGRSGVIGGGWISSKRSACAHDQQYTYDRGSGAAL